MNERHLTARELADQLGMSPDWVLDRFEAGDLPGFKLPGGRVRFRVSEVEAEMESWRRGPTPRSRRLDVV